MMWKVSKRKGCKSRKHQKTNQLEHPPKKAGLEEELVFQLPSLGIQSPSENGFMEPKYYAFRFGDWTPQSSSSENMTIDA